jgi:hypothetical protein
MGTMSKTAKLFFWTVIFFSEAVVCFAGTKAFHQIGELKFFLRPQYPKILFDKKETFFIDVEVSPKGYVLKAVVTAGHLPLRDQVQKVATNWRFLPTGKPVSQRVTLSFAEDDGTEFGPPPRGPDFIGMPITSIQFFGGKREQHRQILSDLQIAEGQLLTWGVMARLRKYRESHPPLQIDTLFSANLTLSIQFYLSR